MAAKLNLSMRLGEQCELASASLAILARHPHKGHTLATLQGSLDCFYTHLRANLPCLSLPWLHHSLPQANIVLWNSLATWVYCVHFLVLPFLPHRSEFSLSDFPSTLLELISVALTFSPSPGRTVSVVFFLTRDLVLPGLLCTHPCPLTMHGSNFMFLICYPEFAWSPLIFFASICQTFHAYSKKARSWEELVYQKLIQPLLSFSLTFIWELFCFKPITLKWKWISCKQCVADLFFYTRY